MIKRGFKLVRRGWRKPPHVIVRWLLSQAGAEIDQKLAPGRARRLTSGRLLKLLGGENIEELWARLAQRPFPGPAGMVAPADYERLCPGDLDRIMAAAEAACAHRVNLLGSGPVELGTPIDWHTDFKSGHGWPMVPFRRVKVYDFCRDSDVKVPWELSRLQWLIPTGQAYRLCGDERYAEGARATIEEWQAANPVAIGVNWACTMDVALRGISLVWLFHSFHSSAAWSDASFRVKFLKLLYIHGDFTFRHIEYSDVNGNHLLADAAGLVAMGLFFGDAMAPTAWQRIGWRILTDEIGTQVFADGVDFEVATAYHRLVLELFLVPALHRHAAGLKTPESYSAALRRMAAFVAAYSRDDGSSPLWGDADDGRVLPFGGQAMTNHRYLVGTVALAFDDAELLTLSAGPKSEAFWLLGPQAEAIPDVTSTPGSRLFPDGGVVIMRSAGDHVFIDCGPVGMAGRGGHGQNDCLSLEAALCGVKLLSDCGTYVYTADIKARNRFRATAAHNTPMIDGEEINRFVRPEYLWTLRDDARPEVRRWETSAEADRLIAAHSGYRRLAQPVTAVRSVLLDKVNHRLVVLDHFEGDGNHVARVPFHLDPNVAIEPAARGQWRLAANATSFLLVSGDVADWQATIEPGWVSPSYGVKHESLVLVFERSGALVPLAIGLMPADDAPADPSRWLTEMATSLDCS